MRVLDQKGETSVTIWTWFVVASFDQLSHYLHAIGNGALVTLLEDLLNGPFQRRNEITSNLCCFLLREGKLQEILNQRVHSS